MNPDQEPEWYTVQDLCKKFGKDRRTIYRWVEEELFPNVKRVKGGIYVPHDDVIALLPTKATRRIISPGVV